MIDQEHEIRELSSRLRGSSAEQILQDVAGRYAGGIAFASSLGGEDQVITDMIVKNNLDIPIFTLDTGRLFEETYELLDRTEKRYGIKIAVYFPKSADIEAMTSRHGVNLFRDSVANRKYCCLQRKIKPLRRALHGLSAWVCGLRREQSVTRSGLDVIEWDEANGLVKVNPLADWSEDEVWKYLADHAVPYNRLHDQGFVSIGCAGCTRAVKPGEHPRSGRWWWEAPEHKECGLHLKNEE